MFRILIAIVLFAHGIGHILGPLQVTRVAVANPEWNGDSWLLSGATGASAAQVIGVALWLAAMVGFIALAAVLMGWLPATWWVPLSIGASLISLAGIVLFPTAFPTTSTIGAVVVDVALLVAVTLGHWLPSDLPA
jgi:hypothetical protein